MIIQLVFPLSGLLVASEGIFLFPCAPFSSGCLVGNAANLFVQRLLLIIELVDIRVGRFLLIRALGKVLLDSLQVSGIIDITQDCKKVLNTAKE